MPAKQIFAEYGPSGTGKTSLLGTFAKGLYEATEKKTRLVTAESAQIGPIAGGIAKGYIVKWSIDNAEFPFERVREATMGLWPEDVENPKSALIQPWVYKYLAKCGQCQKVLYQSDKNSATPLVACPACKTPSAVRVTRELNPKAGLENIGAYLFDGGTAFGEMFMDNMSDRSARGEKMGEETAVRFKDGSVEIAGSSRTSYQIAQRRVKNAVQESRHLPVDYVGWTFTKELGTDDDTRLPVMGPKLPGSKATPDVPRWFGPTLATTIFSDGKGAKEYRLYTQPYYETWLKGMENVLCLVNNRISPAQLDGFPSYYTYQPKDETLLWRVMEEIEKRQLAALEAEANAAATVRK